jgi:hypothetical protein
MTVARPNWFAHLLCNARFGGHVAETPHDFAAATRPNYAESQPLVFPLVNPLFAHRRPRMRFSPAIFVLAIAATSAVSIASAQQDASLQMRIAARRELSVAKNNLRFYWQVDYPQQRRNIDAAIELTRMELKNLNTQLREFRPFTQFSIGQPFPLTVRSLQMCIKSTELRLDNLLAERNALVRFHSDEYDQFAYEVYEARQRVLDLEPADTVPNAGGRLSDSEILPSGDQPQPAAQ